MSKSRFTNITYILRKKERKKKKKEAKKSNLLLPFLQPPVHIIPTHHLPINNLIVIPILPPPFSTLSRVLSHLTTLSLLQLFHPSISNTQQKRNPGKVQSIQPYLMAACGSLQHMFEAPLPPESPISSWNPNLSRTPHPSSPSSSSVTELFGELHFEESPKAKAVPLPPPSSSSFKNATSIDTKSGGRTDEKEEKEGSYGVPRHRSGGSLQLCTEGLGFESLDDVEDSNEQEKIGSTVEDDEAVFRNRDGDRGGYYYCWGVRRRVCGPVLRRWRSTAVTRRERLGGGRCFPPPISSVNRPWVSLRGYRCDGRFVLKEVTVPAQEFLHASREGGRLRLDFVQGTDEDDDDDNDVSDSDSDSDNDDDEEGEDEENEQGEGDVREGNEQGVDKGSVMLVNCDDSR